MLLPRAHGVTGWKDLQLRGITCGVCAILLARALWLVEWSVGTCAVLLATVSGGPGAVLWRICLLFVGGVVASSYAEDLTVLSAAGWEPEPVGHRSLSPARPVRRSASATAA